MLGLGHGSSANAAEDVNSQWQSNRASIGVADSIDGSDNELDGTSDLDLSTSSSRSSGLEEVEDNEGEHITHITDVLV